MSYPMGTIRCRDPNLLILHYCHFEMLLALMLLDWQLLNSYIHCQTPGHRATPESGQRAQNAFWRDCTGQPWRKWNGIPPNQ